MGLHPQIADADQPLAFQPLIRHPGFQRVKLFEKGELLLLSEFATRASLKLGIRQHLPGRRCRSDLSSIIALRYTTLHKMPRPDCWGGGDR